MSNIRQRTPLPAGNRNKLIPVGRKRLSSRGQRRLALSRRTFTYCAARQRITSLNRHSIQSGRPGCHKQLYFWVHSLPVIRRADVVADLWAEANVTLVSCAVVPEAQFSCKIWAFGAFQGWRRRRGGRQLRSDLSYIQKGISGTGTSQQSGDEWIQIYI